MALARKELRKDVGQWFGPSTTAGAIKSLVQSFPDASLGISVAVDSQVFQTDVYLASHPPTQSPCPRKLSRWGGRGVVVLIGIQLGIDGANPIYYETIKALYSFLQSVGIAGGRPSSSYYFVGSQADNLFYLDPHHTRVTIPLRPPTQTSERERERGIPIRQATPERGSVSPPAIIVRQLRLRPVVRVHLHFHIQLHHHLPNQSNSRRVAPPPEAPMFVGTLPALMAPDRICLAQRATQAWTLPTYTT
ncbi:hypothetical protein EI94DRAFT_1755794 [Lactarius quietus]|nr:hypothetical protein EI94DRAFT_1755794 [Lactarius quietus]